MIWDFLLKQLYLQEYTLYGFVLHFQIVDLQRQRYLRPGRLLLSQPEPQNLWTWASINVPRQQLLWSFDEWPSFKIPVCWLVTKRTWLVKKVSQCRVLYRILARGVWEVRPTFRNAHTIDKIPLVSITLSCGHACQTFAIAYIHAKYA